MAYRPVVVERRATFAAHQALRELGWYPHPELMLTSIEDQGGYSSKYAICRYRIEYVQWSVEVWIYRWSPDEIPWSHGWIKLLYRSSGTEKSAEFTIVDGDPPYIKFDEFTG